MEVFLVYSAEITPPDEYGNKHHGDIEINHVSKTLEGAKEWLINKGFCRELEPYDYSPDDYCLSEVPIWQVRDSKWVFLIIKKEIR